MRSAPRDITFDLPVSTSNASIQPAEIDGSSKANALSISTMKTSCIALSRLSSFITSPALSNRKSEITGTIDVFRMKPASVMLRLSAALERHAARAGTGTPRGSESPGSCRCAAGSAASCAKFASNVISPNMSWKNTADMPIVPMVRAIAAAIGTPSMPQRVESDASATAIDRRRAALLVVADHHRAEVGQRRLRPVDVRRAIAGLPVAQADEVEARALKQAAMLADRELAHPPHDEELDLGELRQVHERLDILSLGFA